MEYIQFDLRLYLAKILDKIITFSGGILARDRFITCLLASLCRVALKPVNFEKLQEVIQDKQETLPSF